MNTVNGSSSLTERLNTAIVEVPNFPKKGILFKDITPLLQDIPLFTEVITSLANSLLETLQGIQVDKLAALESRGFIFGMPLAQALNVPLVLVRKKGKLPPPIVAQIYQLEYGEATIEMQENAIHP
jgi:adenine phosphoribosyltransferase